MKVLFLRQFTIFLFLQFLQLFKFLWIFYCIQHIYFDFTVFFMSIALEKKYNGKK